MCLRFSQDGSVIAVGQADGLIRVSIRTKSEILLELTRLKILEIICMQKLSN
jgi:alanine racemase